MKILLTCPPMIKQAHRFKSLFADLGWQVTIPEFTQVLSEDELCKLVPEHDGWIIGDDPASSRVINAGATGRLKAAVKWGVGVDNVDFEAFKSLGLPVINTPGMFGDEVADVALGYVIALARHTFEIHQGVLAGQWPKPSGVSLRGKKVALVGFGDIGRATAARLKVCGMDVTVYDPFAKTEELASLNCQQEQWPNLIDQADFMVFTCALNDSTRHMLNSSVLATVKPGLRLVNVARGPLIDELALLESLEGGVVAAAALDVFEDEPLPMSSPLRIYSQNVFGSHNGSNTIDAVVKTSERAIHLLNDFLQ